MCAAAAENEKTGRMTAVANLESQKSNPPAWKS